MAAWDKTYQSRIVTPEQAARVINRPAYFLTGNFSSQKSFLLVNYARATKCRNMPGIVY
jgi:hypothetical protein